MNLIQQFPDMTFENANKLALRRKLGGRINGRPAIIHSKQEEEVRYYDNEFRKWHYKVALIIAVILTAFFMIIFSIFN